MHLHSTILAFVMPMEKAWKRTARKQLNGIGKPQTRVMRMRNVILAIATGQEKV